MKRDVLPWWGRLRRARRSGDSAEDLPENAHRTPTAAGARHAEHGDGPRYHVRTHTNDGVHAVVGITLADADDTPAVLSEAERAVLRATVRAVLDLEGHEQGRVLSEVVLTAHGSRVLAWWHSD